MSDKPAPSSKLIDGYGRAGAAVNPARGDWQPALWVIGSTQSWIVGVPIQPPSSQSNNNPVFKGETGW